MASMDKKISAFALLLFAAASYYFIIPDRGWLGQPYLETTEKSGFAVVELFTSEGCSSCPPADELLADVRQKAKGKDIYLLAFHVDYWDRLGWQDRFSSPLFSQRQKEYADKMESRTLYTPQFIVNGTDEFPGNDARRLYSTISSVMKQPAATALTAQANSNQGNLALHYKADVAGKDYSLLAALVQKDDSTKVKLGENGGRSLHHVQIVRQLERIALEHREGNIEFFKPEDFNAANWEVVVFLQDNKTGAIHAATRAVLNKNLY